MLPAVLVMTVILVIGLLLLTFQGLIEKHDRSLPVFVEGGYLVWMRDQHLVYFVLRADPRPELVEYNRKPAPHDQDVHKSNIFSFLGVLTVLVMQGEITPL